ncbi:MAG: hypothetical protein LBV39_06125, partial [Bacteroidales bacterium]|nr:hypothetical protein [Bacteroidales bacterium]
MLCFDATTIAQSKIEGIVNTYTKVTSLTNVGNQAVLQVDDVSGFKEHDTVLLIQMTGVRIDRQLVNHAGKYEFHLIASINVSAKTITLRMPADFNPTQELVQLIRVPSYKNAEVISTLTCEPWNYLTGTGGVLAVMTEETLTIAADIDVSSKGFNGGKVTPSEISEVLICNSTAEGYPASAYLFAGNKGEGF